LVLLPTPIPKTVSYAPMIFPEISLLVLVKIISRVNGKNILNPKPIRTKDMPKVMIESAISEISNPIDTAIVAAIKVWLVFLASLPANASDITRDIPKAKYKSKISVPYPVII